MQKKLFKLIPLSLITLLLLVSSFFFVGCFKNENNAYPANNIPHSNVFKDTANYILNNGEKLDSPDFEAYTIRIFGDANSQTQFFLRYYLNDTTLEIGGGVLDANAPMEFYIALSELEDYSKINHTIGVMLLNAVDFYGKITVPAKQYVNMNTTTMLPNFDTVQGNITEAQQVQLHTKLSSVISQLLSEFSNFYANTIKQNKQFLGATYKYFYLPVIK